MRSQALRDELSWRGFLFQHTEGAFAALDEGMTSGYVGFDPTQSSLHVGNLVPVMGLVHLQRHGHRPIVLVGGGTGLIGDPSGRQTERTLLTADQVAANVAGIRGQLERFVDFGGENAAIVVDNAEWLRPLGAIEFMRDVGKHFTVNYMLQKDSVKSRMEDGISYTEFSYMLLQAYDFLELSRRHGARLQMGGSDQWGNITAGIELIRRSTGGEAHAITFPLLMTSAGTKFGKTADGAVWLDRSRTSPYRFYQYWMSAEDADVGRLLRFFTLLPREEIEALDQTTLERPQERAAQRALARDVTTRVHGADAMRAAEEVSAVLFGGADPVSLSADAFASLAEEIPTIRANEAVALTPAGIVAAVTSDTGVFKSKAEARRLIEQGGFYVNGARVTADAGAFAPIHGRYLLLRKGARSFTLLVVDQAASTASP
jgi:tyrosyl-tRNA synthetase